MRRTALLTLLSDWLPKLVSFATVVLLARRLGAPEFAELAVALSWIGYAWWGVDLGQAGYSIRTLAAATGAEQRRLGSEIFSLYLALAAVVSGIVVLLLAVTGGLGGGSGRLLLAMTPYLLCYALFPDWWLRARGQLWQLGAANWAVAGGFLAAVLALPSGDAVLDALAFGLSPLAGAVVSLGVLGRAGQLPRVRASRTAWRTHLRTSLLFSASGAGGQVATPLALASMTAASPGAAGAFALGLRASGAAANALWLLLHNALPHLLAQRRADSRRRLDGRHVLAAAVPPLLGVLVAVALWPPIRDDVVGPSYSPYGGYLLLGVALLVVWGPKYLVEINLIASFGDLRRIVMNLVAPVLVVAALLAGITDQHPWVMPAALLLGEALATGLGFVLVNRRPAEATTPALAEPAATTGPDLC
jgi:O-antigen/teichoic acid export membrane protein